MATNGGERFFTYRPMARDLERRWYARRQRRAWARWCEEQGRSA